MTKARGPNLRRWLGCIGAFIFALVAWAAVQRVADVAAVQNAVNRNIEIEFTEHAYATGAGTGKPGLLPAWIDTWVGRFADTLGENERGFGRGPAWQERFRALFRGQILNIDIYESGKFHSDLGAAMARFPALRRVAVYENWEGGPTEADWKLLCTHLRTFPHLEEIEIGGAWLTDDALSPLAGHPQLRRVIIMDGRLTKKCAGTFASLPRLTFLRIEEMRSAEGTWLSPEQKAAMAAQFPAATVELR